MNELDGVEFLEDLPPLVRASRAGDLGEVRRQTEVSRWRERRPSVLLPH